mgnify:FL=1
MEVKLIKIGSSKGIRLKKSIIERYGIKDKAEILLEKDRIILKPVKNPRQGWDEAFKKMREKGDDNLLIDDVFPEEEPLQWK